MKTKWKYIRGDVIFLRAGETELYREPGWLQHSPSALSQESPVYSCLFTSQFSGTFFPLPPLLSLTLPVASKEWSPLVLHCATAFRKGGWMGGSTCFHWKRLLIHEGIFLSLTCKRFYFGVYIMLPLQFREKWGCYFFMLLMAFFSSLPIWLLLGGLFQRHLLFNHV